MTDQPERIDISDLPQPTPLTPEERVAFIQMEIKRQNDPTQWIHTEVPVTTFAQASYSNRFFAAIKPWFRKAGLTKDADQMRFVHEALHVEHLKDYAPPGITGDEAVLTAAINAVQGTLAIAYPDVFPDFVPQTAPVQPEEEQPEDAADALNAMQSELQTAREEIARLQDLLDVAEARLTEAQHQAHRQAADTVNHTAYAPWTNIIVNNIKVSVCADPSRSPEEIAGEIWKLRQVIECLHGFEGVKTLGAIVDGRDKINWFKGAPQRDAEPSFSPAIPNSTPRSGAPAMPPQPAAPQPPADGMADSKGRVPGQIVTSPFAYVRVDVQNGKMTVSLIPDDRAGSPLKWAVPGGNLTFDNQIALLREAMGTVGMSFDALEPGKLMPLRGIVTAIVAEGKTQKGNYYVNATAIAITA